MADRNIRLIFDKTKTNNKIMTTQETIKELEIEIQYLQAVLANGWHISRFNQDDKNITSAQLEQLEKKVTKLRKTL